MDNTLTKAIGDLKDYIAKHKHHISAQQLRVYRKRLSKLRTDLRAYQQRIKATAQQTHQLNINI